MGKVEVTWDEFDVFWFDDNFLVANDEKAKDFPPDAVTRPTNTPSTQPPMMVSRMARWLNILGRRGKRANAPSRSFTRRASSPPRHRS